MKISESSKSNKLFDSHRNKILEAKPEEIVRQRLLTYMKEKLGYPSSHIAVEKKLSSFPDVKTGRALQGQRIDILCYALLEKTLKPLLLIECKEKMDLTKDLPQLLGYNEWVKAPFFALADKNEVCTFWRKAEGDLEKVSFLPTYPKLVESLL